MIRKLVRNGTLPSARVGSVPLILVEDLVGCLKAQRTNPNSEAEQIAAELEESLRSAVS
jgi:hypothetical protein